MTEEFEEKTGTSFISELYDWVEPGLTAFVCVVLILLFVARTIDVDGESMHPTLSNSDRLISTHMLYTPHPGDIIVITQPNTQNKPLIKRVVATAGQTVDIDFEEGIVTVDGAVLNEEYINEPTYTKFDVVFPQTVPEGHVFAMGDNRNHSWDSRASEVGMIKNDYIMGKVIYRFGPYNKLGVPR